MDFFNLSPRGRQICLALSALGARPLDRVEVAAKMDAELTFFPYLPPEQVLRPFVEKLNILPGLRDNGTGGLERSDTDVAAYVAGRLER